MKIAFKRVGADTAATSGGCLSPLFPGRFYHFITLPRHVDPELFYKFTYGDLLQSKRKPHNPNGTATPLKELRKDDVFALYAGFESTRNHKRSVGIFAYIVIERAYVLSHKNRTANEFSDAGLGKMTYSQYLDCIAEFAGWNPHAEKGAWQHGVDQVLICGDPNRSRMFSKVEHLADLKAGQYRVDSITAARWGLKPHTSLTRNMPRWVECETVQRVWRQLQRLP